MGAVWCYLSAGREEGREPEWGVATSGVDLGF